MIKTDIYSTVHRIFKETEVGNVSEFAIEVDGLPESISILLVEWLVNWPGLGIRSKQLIACVAGELINEQFLSTFQHEVNRADDAIGLVVYSGSTSKLVSELLRKFPALTVITFEQLIESSINASRYINNWFPDHTPTNLTTFYVERREWQTIREVNEIQTESTPMSSFSLSSYTDQWLADGDNRNQLALLGGAGAGKTWFCWHYCMRQMERYKNDPTTQRLPIYIRLSVGAHGKT